MDTGEILCDGVDWINLHQAEMRSRGFIYLFIYYYFANTMMNVPVSEKQYTLWLPNVKLYAEDLVTWISLIT
jgi:hypothetical protein